MNVVVDSRVLWLAATNCFLVYSETGGEAVIIDAPPDLGTVEVMVRQHGVVPVAALVTHAHVDHWGGAGSLAARYRLRTFLHPGDDWLAADPGSQVRTLFGVDPGTEYDPPEVYETLEDGQSVKAAGMAFEVLHTPGHTPGHCCFHLPEEGILFSGDQLFAGSIGRTDLPGGDYGTLMRSMGEKIVTLDGATRVLPGHGPETTIADELASNPFLQEFR